jgi:hypothetical protein
MSRALAGKNERFVEIRIQMEEIEEIGKKPAPVMINKSAMVTLPPARNMREGSSCMDEKWCSRYCAHDQPRARSAARTISRAHDQPRAQVRGIQLATPHLNTCADFGFPAR